MKRLGRVLGHLGRVLGELDLTFASFGHPGAFREIDWDLGRTLLARTRLDAVHATSSR